MINSLGTHFLFQTEILFMKHHKQYIIQHQDRNHMLHQCQSLSPHPLNPHQEAQANLNKLNIPNLVLYTLDTISAINLQK